MRTCIYPGSFSPWHEGHTDVLIKALQVFDKVIVARGVNPDKKNRKDEFIPWVGMKQLEALEDEGKIEFEPFNTLLVEFIVLKQAHAVIRGLRNGTDLEFERTQQYWNEDLGIIVPTVYFVCDRKLVHISSSAIRVVEAFKCIKEPNNEWKNDEQQQKLVTPCTKSSLLKRSLQGILKVVKSSGNS